MKVDWRLRYRINEKLQAILETDDLSELRDRSSGLFLLLGTVFARNEWFELSKVCQASALKMLTIDPPNPQNEVGEEVK